MKKGQYNVFSLRKNEWVNSWFSEVKVWDKEVVDGERVMWVRLYRLPCVLERCLFRVHILDSGGIYAVLLRYAQSNAF